MDPRDKPGGDVEWAKYNNLPPLIPAKAGIQFQRSNPAVRLDLDSGFRRNDAKGYGAGRDRQPPSRFGIEPGDDPLGEGAAGDALGEVVATAGEHLQDDLCR